MVLGLGSCILHPEPSVNGGCMYLCRPFHSVPITCNNSSSQEQSNTLATAFLASKILPNTTSPSPYFKALNGLSWGSMDQSKTKYLQVLTVSGPCCTHHVLKRGACSLRLGGVYRKCPPPPMHLHSSRQCFSSKRLLAEEHFDTVYLLMVREYSKYITVKHIVYL